MCQMEGALSTEESSAEWLDHEDERHVLTNGKPGLKSGRPSELSQEHYH